MPVAAMNQPSTGSLQLQPWQVGGGGVLLLWNSLCILETAALYSMCYIPNLLMEESLSAQWQPN